MRYEISRQAARADRRRPGRAGDPALARGHRHHDVRAGRRRRPRTTATSRSPTSCPIAPDRGVGRGAAGRPAGATRRTTPRGCRQAWGLTDLEMQSLVNAGALDLVEETVAAGAPAGGRPQVVARRARPARQRATASSSPRCRSRPAQVARVEALVDAGDAQRQAGPPGHRGRARRRGRRPTRSSRARPAPSCRDDAALLAAVDEALAANPDVAEKIRGGKVAAAGALVGAVMKATRGQADAGPGPRAGAGALRPVLTARLPATGRPFLAGSDT